MKFGYITQIINLFVLLSTNLLLPLLIGIEDYGKIIYVYSFTYLLLSFFDDGMNSMLLTGKHTIEFVFVFKNIFLIILAMPFLFYGILFFNNMKLLIAIFIQNFFYSFYTLLVSWQIVKEKKNILIFSSINYFIAMFFMPLFFAYFYNDFLEFVPFLSFLIMMLFVYFINHLDGLEFDIKKVKKILGKISIILLIRVFINQLQLSAKLLFFGVLLWGSIIFLKQYGTTEGLGSFRVAISLIIMIAMLIPIHRQTAIVIMNNKGRTNEIQFYFILAFVMYIFILFLFFTIGNQVINYFFNKNAKEIYELVSILIFLVPFKIYNEIYFVVIKNKDAINRFIILFFFLILLFFLLISLIQVKPTNIANSFIVIYFISFIFLFFYLNFFEWRH